MTKPVARKIRFVRAAASSVFGLLYFFLFLELFVSFPIIVNVLNGIQFFPSVIKIAAVSALYLVFPAIVLFFTLIFGRFYCAFLCPLGGLQDLFLFGIRKTPGARRFRRQRPFLVLHYAILGVTLAGLVFGNVAALTFFEPFSAFGRIIADLVRQGLDAAINGISAVFQSFGFYLFPRVNRLPVGAALTIAVFLFLAGLFVLTLFSGRKYCNTLCPTGAVLRFFSNFSFFRIRINAGKCVFCGLCEAACRAGCVDARNKTVDPARCVLCFDCLTVCDYSAIRYSAPHKTGKKIVESGKSRRVFLSSTVSGLLSLPFIGSAAHAISTGKPVINKKTPVLPPGSKSLKAFLERCTACHQCVASCPNRIIRPSLFELGLSGLFQPVLDYRLYYCGFECNTCTQVCPTGAIAPLSLKEKQVTRIGLSKLLIDKCIVYDKKLECGACAEHCPNKAVHLISWNGLRAPVTDDTLCIGCGACQYVCPVNPKAIFVEGLAVHERAKPRNDRKIERKKEKADFPF